MTAENIQETPPACSAQPVSNVQWVATERLFSNDYNPNRVFAREMRLLKLSILEHGWTQPIVVRDAGDGRYEIVDGFHRYRLATEDDDVAILTAGLVPIVMLRNTTAAGQRAATIRHNRARGTHYVVDMAAIVRSMVDDYVLDPDDVATALGMEREEVDRLYHRGGMIDRGSRDTFNAGWVPG